MKDVDIAGSAGGHDPVQDGIDGSTHSAEAPPFWGGLYHFCIPHCFLIQVRLRYRHRAQPVVVSGFLATAPSRQNSGTAIRLERARLA